MFIIKVPTRRGFKLKMSWFCDDKKLLRTDRLLCIYKQASVDDSVTGLKKIDFHTKLIDLTQDLPSILKGFDKNTVYEVRRAERDQVTFRIVEDVNSFVSFFNDFARAKKIRTTTAEELLAYGDKVILTAGCLENDFLAMHSYVLDRENKRARLQYSGSSYIGDSDNARRAAIGRANRYLHYKDMEYFKEQGFEQYDLGGYAWNTTNKEMIGVNSFKDSFGGVLVKEYDYYPAWLYWLTKIKQSL